MLESCAKRMVSTFHLVKKNPKKISNEYYENSQKVSVSKFQRKVFGTFKLGENKFSNIKNIQAEFASYKMGENKRPKKNVWP